MSDEKKPRERKYGNGYYQKCDCCKDRGTSHFSGMCKECREKNKLVNSIRLFGKTNNKAKFYEQEEDVYGV